MPEGIVDLENYKLNLHTLEQLQLVIKEKGVCLDNFDLFIQEVNEAISNYLAQIQLRNKSKPSQVRNNLKATIGQVEKLKGKIKALDSKSLRLIQEEEKDALTKIDWQLGMMEAVLSGAYSKAEEYPKKGSLPEIHKVELAKGIALAIQNQLASRQRLHVMVYLKQVYR